jgi:CRISPR-associated protein (TIGR02710 family)
LLVLLKQQKGHLNTLDASQGPTQELVKDLLANARRRAVEGRFDDAVARLYRGIEAIAQTRLREAHGIADTGGVALQQIPETLRPDWEPFAREGKVKVALQDAFVLLGHLDDPMAHRFRELELDQRDRSPLVSRNTSILAHGFQPVSQNVFPQLWKAALSLADLAEDDLPQFPRLGKTN